MAEPPIPTQLAPYKVELEAGQEVWWCFCGRSASQPFCDGSHKGTGLSPQSYKAERSGPAFFCGCRQSANRPLCDGTHRSVTA